MIIILEGPDGSGKTTLANKLAEQTGYDVVHMSMPKSEEEKVKMFSMYKQALEESDNVIFDRCWYSEMAYGPVMRGASYISHNNMYELENILAKKGAIVIYCKDNPKTLWSRCMRRGEDYVTKFRSFLEICYNFEVLFRKTEHKVPVVYYSYKVEGDPE